MAGRILANDSNRKEDERKYDGYDGQLERYYNTIKKGIDKDGNEAHDFQCNTVFIYYLTMYKEEQPSKESIGELESIQVIYYGNEIRNWLDMCLKIIPEEKILVSNTIQQYLNLINKLTHNDIPIEERIELKNIVSINWSSTKYLIENFKHIKWHTVHEFWTTLKFFIEKEYSNVFFFPENFDSAITELTHNNNNINLGVVFDIRPNKKAYISSLDTLNWGIIEPKKWGNFNDVILENISFFDFSTENTYRLIDKDNIKNAVEIILSEISMEKENNFGSLKPE